MTALDHAALRALAEAATPGEWAHEADIREDRSGKSEVDGWNINSGTQEIIGCEGILGDGKPDAAYIAAAHPAAVLALLDENARLREALAFYGGHDPDNSDHGEWLESMNEDGGDVARAALGEPRA